MTNGINPTSVNQLMSWLESTLPENGDLYNTAHTYLDWQRARKNDTAPHPFLSIITRTQGKRRQMLTETLLCLTGQSDPDFEVLLMGHNLNEEQDAVVRGIIDDLPLPMREKTRLIPVTGGTRTTPLNEGFRAAKGDYIAILDDDDIVFDNWVESFHKKAEETPGRLLHAYTAFQSWEVVGQKPDECPRAATAFSNQFCVNFDLYNELVLNRCPPVGLAFPADAFRDLGLRFDESLTTNEDWDFMMRTLFLTGLSDIETVTCVYRGWINAENSQTVHGQTEWDKNYWKIVNAFRQTPVLFPAGTFDKMFDETIEAHTEAIRKANEQDAKKGMLQLALDPGDGFSGGSTVMEKSRPDGDGVSVTFRIPQTSGKLHAIRYSPTDSGRVEIRGLRFDVTFTDGKKAVYTERDVSCNGYRTGRGLLFLKGSPCLLITFPNPAGLAEVTVRYQLTEDTIDSAIDLLIVPDGGKKDQPSLCYRILRRAWHLFKRILKGKKKQ